MKRVLVIILSLLLVCFACERKAGRGPGQSSSRQISRNSNTRSSRSSSNGIRRGGSSTIQTVEANNGEMTGADLFEKYNSAVFMIYTSDGWNDYQGSGFFISKDGVAVSNYHVFQGTGIGYEQILLSDGSKCKVQEVIAKSSEDDIIVFKVEGKSKLFNCIPIAKQTPRVGEKAYAIGSPRGLENTFSSGEVSQIRGGNILQINVPIDHGSSGGVLLNVKGEAIGITSAGFDNSGANLNFAIDINVLKKYVKLSN